MDYFNFDKHYLNGGEARSVQSRGKGAERMEKRGGTRLRETNEVRDFLEDLKRVKERERKREKGRV